MFNYAKAGNLIGDAQWDFLWWQWGLNEIHPWQYRIMDAVDKHAILGEMNATVREADIIVVGMVHTPAALSAIYAIKDAYPDKPVLMEIDDNILSTPEYNPAAPFYGPDSELRQIAIDQMKVSDGVICSTPYLAEIYAEFNPDTFIVQNAIDFGLWGKAQAKRKGGIRIGWAGGASHVDDLESILPAVKNILKDYKDVRFVLVHGIPESFKGIPGVECFYKWSRIDKYPQTLAGLDFDIGIAPLIDNAFNRGKSNLRWLEYSALGIPTVASKVGHFAETVNHGVDGYLADSCSEFESYLRDLIESRTLRKTIGARAKDRVVRDFNVNGIARDYHAILKAAVERGPVSSPPEPATVKDLANAAKFVGELMKEEEDEPRPA